MWGEENTFKEGTGEKSISFGTELKRPSVAATYFIGNRASEKRGEEGDGRRGARGSKELGRQIQGVRVRGSGDKREALTWKEG